jgi:hypothetical protein
MNNNSSRGLSPEAMRAALNSGNKEALLKSLSPRERELFYSLLADKEARDRLLSSPKVAELIKNLMNGG